MVFIDFDDTLFPTSWLRTNAADLMDGKKGSLGHLQAPLILLATKVKAMLDAASAVAEVVILTNAKEGWVDFCLKTFMPSLLPVFQNLKVVYGRVAFANSGVADVQLCPCRVRHSLTDEDVSALAMACKVEAMRAINRDFYKDHSWKNMVSIGDSFDELFALQEVAFLHENPRSLTTGHERDLRAKAIKFQQNPSCQSLLLQVSIVQQYILACIGYDGDLFIPVKFNEKAINNLHLNEKDAIVWSRRWAQRRGAGDLACLLNDAFRNLDALMSQRTQSEFAEIVLDQSLS